jgi:DNA-binding FadR family transcriptional regulator
LDWFLCYQCTSVTSQAESGQLDEFEYWDSRFHEALAAATPAAMQTHLRHVRHNMVGL